jgi:capsular polysaccharide biosynthesis protein
VQTSKAITPDKPVSPNKLLLLVAGTLAGLIAAAGVVLMAMLTNRTFLSEGSVERFLGLPVLGSVPLRGPDYHPRLA